jgi:transcriptional regulator with XRE-family HTH domain
MLTRMLAALAALLLLKGWSRRDLAREAGVAVGTVLDLEHRARAPVRGTLACPAGTMGARAGAPAADRQGCP